MSNCCPIKYLNWEPDQPVFKPSVFMATNKNWHITITIFLWMWNLKFVTDNSWEPFWNRFSPVFLILNRWFFVRFFCGNPPTEILTFLYSRQLHTGNLTISLPISYMRYGGIGGYISAKPVLHYQHNKKRTTKKLEVHMKYSVTIELGDVDITQWKYHPTDRWRPKIYPLGKN